MKSVYVLELLNIYDLFVTKSVMMIDGNTRIEALGQFHFNIGIVNINADSQKIVTEFKYFFLFVLFNIYLYV